MDMIARTIRFSLCLGFFLVALCTYVPTSHGSKKAIKVKDAFGKTVTIRSSKRIVSLNGTVTEALFALGAGASVVGRDTSSYYPKSALKLPTVGYQHRLNAEGILRLRPTLVIGLSSVKPLIVLKQIQSAGVTVLLLKTPLNVTTSRSMLRKLGQALGQQKRAKKLLDTMKSHLDKLAKARKANKTKQRVMALYLRGTRMRFVLGTHTTVGGMVSLIGATNVARFKRVKPISAEAMVAARPNVIVLFAKGLKSIGGIKGLKRIPGLALTPAGKNNRFVIMDDLYLGGFGPRCGRAALDLFRGVYRTKGLFKK